MTDSETGYQPVDYAARRQAKAADRASSSHRRRAIIAGGVLIAVLVLASAAEAAVTAGRIHPGVSVAGIKVGGMKPANAVAVLRTALPTRASEAVQVTYGKKSWDVQPTDVGLSFDYDDQVARAMAIGRNKNALGDASDRASAWLGGVDVAAVPTLDDEKLDLVLDKIAKGTDKRPKNATVDIVGVTPKVVDGKDGRALDRDQCAELIARAFTKKSNRVVEAPVPVAKMAVTAASARSAAGIAETMLSGPVTVEYKDKSWTFDPEDIAPWISFRAVESSATGGSAGLEPFVRAKSAADPITKALGTTVGRSARDARFQTSSGRVSIIPSRQGVGPDVDALAKSLSRVLTDPKAERTVQLRTQRTQPEITTDKARTMGIKERISTYTTTYDGTNTPRVTNIHLLGDALDGALVEPGGVFSFNGQAGERTADKGYQEAPAIVNGKLVPQLGGGVCQVGTTIFNAVFESGLPVVERHNHSFYISHYPKGRDATVSWGGPDFKFKNDTDDWVLVSVSYTNYSLTISLYGTDPGYDVRAKTGDFTDTKPFATETIKDKDMPKGSKVVEDAGITGRSIVVKRIVSKDGKVVRTDEFYSKYRPKVQVVRVGTKETTKQSDTKSGGT